MQGSEHFSAPLQLSVTHASQEAKQAIEEVDGIGAAAGCGSPGDV